MQPHTDRGQGDRFPTDPSGLPEAGRLQLLELAPGATLDLEVGPVAKRLGDATVRMLGYNGSVPGPTLKVPQGSELLVHVTNHGGPGHHRALARAAAGEPLRRRPP
jgi:hypothetical protein